MRFRRRGSEWSRWFELHWADNLEDDIENAYRPQVIAPDEETYIDLIVYHSRTPPRHNLNIAPREGSGTIDPGYKANPCLLTFYAKPFLRGPLVRDPCEGEPPTIEYLKPPFNEVYEVEVLVKCTNASAKADLNLEITLSSEELSITLWPINTQKPSIPLYYYTG
ncbi:MAG: hypothetical protein F7B18_02830, partial [Desulfurococcales archaeon]|nr:hypothetical protein [Desulfurococcales archaeon]